MAGRPGDGLFRSSFFFVSAGVRCLTCHFLVLQSVKKEADGTLTLTLENGEVLGSFDQVLVAAGREPILDALGLDSAGVKTDQGYITVRNWRLWFCR